MYNAVRMTICEETRKKAHGMAFHTLIMVALWSQLAIAEPLAQADTSNASHSQGMIFLQHAEPRFREGLRRHDLLAGSGYRLLNTGMTAHAFGDMWLSSPLLAEAKASGQVYYVDRISGGMPFQSLEGMDAVLKNIGNDPNFLGVQVHEWGNSPIHDYERIHQLILDKGLPFDAEQFAPFEGRTTSPYFSGGDFSVYQDVFQPMVTLDEVEQYLERYFRKIVALTSGQVMSVTGFGQLHHAALRLGAKNIMPEVGNQVPLSALQIAFARGAARQYDRPFGVYYEPWGGSPMGCSCALDFSPWFPDEPALKEKMDGYSIGKRFGSSRSLQRRLLYYAWLSGAAFYGEEWGLENYFGDWEDYPLTEYGRIVEEFTKVNRAFERPVPIVPAALVMPPDTFGVDIRYVAGSADKVWRMAPPDAFHQALRVFAAEMLGVQPARPGGDAHNLTPSPWIGCFDVLSNDAAPELLNEYALLIYFDEAQADASPVPTGRALVYRGGEADAAQCAEAIAEALPYRVEGRVGVTEARSSGVYLVGVFNNLGVTKTVAEGETYDAEAVQTVTITGECRNAVFLQGADFVVKADDGRVELNLPSGQLALMSFPDPAGE